MQRGLKNLEHVVIIYFLDQIETKCFVLGFKDSLNFPHLAGNIGKSDLMAGNVLKKSFNIK